MNQVSIDQARLDLRDTGSLTDDQVQDYIDRAAEIVSDYLGVDPFTNDDPLSPHILSAIRIVVVRLFQDPGGDTDPLSPAVISLLTRSRTPALS